MKSILTIIFAIAFGTRGASVKLQSAYEIGRLFWIEHGLDYRYSIDRLDIVLNQQTLDYLKAHKKANITNFKDVKEIRFSESYQYQSYYDSDRFPSDFVNNMSAEDILVFQNWLDGIEELDSITKLITPSFFKIKTLNNLKEIHILHYQEIDTSMYINASQIDELSYYSQGDNWQTFDFIAFKNISKLWFRLHAYEDTTFTMPDLSSSKNLIDFYLRVSNTDHLKISGLLYGKRTHFLCENVTNLSIGNLLGMDNMSFLFIENHDSLKSGLDLRSFKSKSKEISLSLILPRLKVIDFELLPKNIAFESIFLTLNSLEEIKFPKIPTQNAHELYLGSKSLTSISKGFDKLSGIKKVTTETPNLVTIDKSFFQADSLIFLDLGWKSKLERLPKGIENLPVCQIIELRVDKIYRRDVKRISKVKSIKTLKINRSKSILKNDFLLNKTVKRYFPNASIYIYDYLVKITAY